MKTRATLGLPVVVIAACGALAILGEGSCCSRPGIRLRMVDEAGISPGTLSRAEREATAVLKRSGVDLTFITCGVAPQNASDACNREVGPAEFWFRLVVRKPTKVSAEMLGFAELYDAAAHAWAAVYYPAAVESAKTYHADVFQIIGAAIAHEVGHLILGANEHTLQGVMSPLWTRTQFELISISELSFTRDQSKRLQNEIRARNASLDGVALGFHSRLLPREHTKNALTAAASDAGLIFAKERVKNEP